MAQTDIDKLTVKEEMFCIEYVRLLNGKQAAINAGYSTKHAEQKAHTLMLVPRVAARIQYLKDNIAEASMIGALRIVEEHRRIAFANIADLYDDWIELKDFNSLTKDQKAAIKKIDTKTERRRLTPYTDNPDQKIEYADIIYVKIEMHDKIRALDSLTKMLGYDGVQKLEITGANGEALFNKIDLSRLDDDELIMYHQLMQKALG